MDTTDTTDTTDRIAELLTGVRQPLTVDQMTDHCAQLYRAAYRDHGPRDHATVHIGLALAALRECDDALDYMRLSGHMPEAVRVRVHAAAAHLAEASTPEGERTGPDLADPQPYITHTRIGQLLGTDDPAPPTDCLTGLCLDHQRTAEATGNSAAASEFSAAFAVLYRVDWFERNPDLLRPRGELPSDTPARLLRQARVHLVQAQCLLDTTPHPIAL